MPARRSHSLNLPSRLALSLAWVAGYVNAAAVLTCGVVTSHVTGHASMLGLDAARSSWVAVALMAALIGAFFVGAVISGLALELGRLRGWSSIYVLPASIELALLAAFAVGVRLHDPSATEVGGGLWWMATTAALAMGVQNATITRISNGIVRTTHLTGIVTDLGHESAQLAVARRLRGQGLPARAGEPLPTSGRRLLLLMLLVVAFVFGSACGGWVYFQIPRWSMLGPMLLLAWIIIADIRTPIGEGPERRISGDSA